MILEYPNSLAMRLAIVLFPAPEGPSMAMLLCFTYRFPLTKRRGADPGGMAGGPGDLKIESAGIGVHVQDLTGKEKSLTQLGGHGLRRYLRDRDPAGGDNGLRHRAKPGH